MGKKRKSSLEKCKDLARTQAQNGLVQVDSEASVGEFKQLRDKEGFDVICSGSLDKLPNNKRIKATLDWSEPTKRDGLAKECSDLVQTFWAKTAIRRK